MKRKPVQDRCCLNPECPLLGQFGKGNIIRHSFYKTSQGRRRRYLCKRCRKTFCSTAGTPYYRLQKSRATFDEVTTMAVEGVSISATARIKSLAPDTVAHWREKAAEQARIFNDQRLKGFDLTELQADEIRAFMNTKRTPIWILTLLEVWSRLWVSCVVGRRSYLDGSMALQRCHYNFIRPHMALKFGKETRTPAMQAGIVSRKLTFRDIFTCQELLYLCLLIWIRILCGALNRNTRGDTHS